MRLRVVDDADRGVFLEQFPERLPQLDVVLALLGSDGDREHRGVGRDLGERWMRLLAVAQSLARCGMIELAERDGVAGFGGAALLAVLTHELENSGDASRLALGVQQIGAVGDFTRKHAGHRHLAAMRGVDGLEQVSDSVAALHAEPFCGVRDAGGLVAQRLHQAQHAVGARGRTEQHGADQTLAQFLGEIVEDLVARRLNVLEQLLHQLVVMVGQRLEHGESGRLLAVERIAFERDDLRRRVLLVDERAFEREIDESADDLAGKGRYLAQHQLAARGRLQHPEHVMDGGVGLVDLVEEQKARDFLRFQLAQNELQLRHLLLVELAHHDRGVDCRQRRAHVVDEFNRARAIDESISVAHEIGAGDGEFDAHLVMTRLLAGIADGVLRVDRALALDGAGSGKNCFE